MASKNVYPGGYIETRPATGEDVPATPVQLSGSNLSAAIAVTPNDSVDLAVVGQAIYVGVSGSVVLTVDGTDVTFTNLAAGAWHPMPPFTRVKTSSTATGIIAGA